MSSTDAFASAEDTMLRKTLDTKAEFVKRSTGFRDLSSRTALFRSKLIDEFRLLEIGFLTTDAAPNAPHVTSADIQADPDMFKTMLAEQPNQLIKFKMFKRHNGGARKLTDKRLLRVRNRHTLPVGVWAHWLVNTKTFNNVVLFMIALNAVMLGVQTELPVSQFYRLHDIMNIVDMIILTTFAVEIAIKWLDSFRNFWTDGWNVFDFVLTVTSAVPEILLLFTTSSATQSADLDGTARIAKQLRVFRTFRSLKMIVRFSSLRVIVRTIITAFESITSVLVLLVLLAYIFSIFAINLFEKYTLAQRSDLLYQEKFESLGSAFITLFQLLTLDQWYFIHNDFGRMTDPTTTLVFFITWVCVGAFIFRNIFVGAMVRNFQYITVELYKNEREDEHIQELAQALILEHKQRSPMTPIRSQAKRSIAYVLHPRFPWSRIRATDPAMLLRSDGAAADGNYAITPSGNKTIDEATQLLWQLGRESVNGDAVSTFDVLEGAFSYIKDKKIEYLWPRDTLFKYLQTLESLQENMKEYEELQLLATEALLQIHDS